MMIYSGQKATDNKHEYLDAYAENFSLIRFNIIKRFYYFFDRCCAMIIIAVLNVLLFPK